MRRIVLGLLVATLASGLATSWASDEARADPGLSLTASALFADVIIPPCVPGGGDICEDAPPEVGIDICELNPQACEIIIDPPPAQIDPCDIDPRRCITFPPDPPPDPCVVNPGPSCPGYCDNHPDDPDCPGFCERFPSDCPGTAEFCRQNPRHSSCPDPKPDPDPGGEDDDPVTEPQDTSDDKPPPTKQPTRQPPLETDPPATDPPLTEGPSTERPTDDASTDGAGSQESEPRDAGEPDDDASPVTSGSPAPTPESSPFAGAETAAPKVAETVPPPLDAIELALSTPEDTAIEVPLGEVQMPGADSESDDEIAAVIPTVQLVGVVLPSWTVLAEPDLGVLSTLESGGLEYAPERDVHGTDMFTLEICLSPDACLPLHVTVAITAEDDPLEAVDDEAETALATPLEIDVLANDLDVDGDGDPSTLTVVSMPATGTAEVAEGVIVYTPDDGWVGEDAFTYEVCDSSGTCDQARVDVVVGNTCVITSDMVAGMTVNPAEGPAGITFAVEVQWAEPDTSCDGFVPGLLRFDGEVFGDPVSPSDGPVSREHVVPDNAVEGESVIDLVDMADDSVELASTRFAVVGAGIPLWPLALVAPVLAAPVVAQRLRRPKLPPEPSADEPPDRCGLERSAVQAAEVELERAHAEAERANAEAQAARARLSRHAKPGGQSPTTTRSTDSSTPPPVPIKTPGSGPKRVTPTGSFYLLEHQNPHAAAQGSGAKGWFLPARGAAIRGIVLLTSGPWDGGGRLDVAQQLAHTSAPVSAHVAIDGDGVLDLLPDSYTAWHSADVDVETLAVVLPAHVDERALGHLAAWIATKTVQHGINLRRVRIDEFEAGQSGLLAGDDVPGRRTAGPGASFPWDKLATLAVQRGRGAVSALPRQGEGGEDDAGSTHLPAASADGPVTPPAEPDTAEEQARAARERADAAEARVREAEQRLAQRREDLSRCEAIPAVVDVRLPAQPQRQEEETEEKITKGWYLLDHPNPFGRATGDGGSGWYYPGRRGQIRGIVVHTAESYSAPEVARYFARVQRPASAHVATDTLYRVNLLPDDHTAFHAKGGNAEGLGIEICYVAARWGSDAGRERLLLLRGAAWCAEKAMTYGIPLQRLTAAQWRAGGRGFIAHADLDPSRRTDPGPAFPWDRFFDLVARAQPGKQGGALSPAEAFIIAHESGGKTTAQNPTSTAFGLGQLLKANRIFYAMKLGLSGPNTTDRAEQLAMFRAYIKDRYGTAEAAAAFWKKNRWY